MIVSAPSVVTTGARRHRRPAARPSTPALERAARQRQPVDLDTASARWQVALDTAQRALTAAGGSLPSVELGARARALGRERQETAEILARLAKTVQMRPAPWLSPVPLRPDMLGLPATVTACIFDLDGVLTDSAVLHAWAWGEVFDDFLLRLGEKTGMHFVRFDRDHDYRAYLDGRPRLDGIHALLASRGIHLPEGRVGDPIEAASANALARRKGEVLARGLRERGSTALPGARRYLESAGHAGLKRAVISASTHTLPMLELAGLASLVEERVDAGAIQAEGLRPRPAPDLLLAACRRLDVRPEEAVTFTHSPAGIAAGVAAGAAVIGIAEGAQAELLRGFGAARVYPALTALLDRSLAGSASP
jgi:HAD superfamily hydrolase (TIGR01509 family)